MLSIPITIGMSDRFRIIEGLTERSILRNTSTPCEISHVATVPEEGCTGFSNVRYRVRDAIYLDPDMIVLGDIAELWELREAGRFVCLRDGTTEVAIITGYEHTCRNKREEHLLAKSCVIPLNWNVEDKVTDGAKLVHFTDLSTQPWFHDHPDPDAVALYEAYR